MNLKPGTAVVALLLIACGRGGAANNAATGAAPPPAAAAKLSAPEAAAANAAAPAPAADLSSARRLIETIYAPYTREETSDYFRYFTPELNAAIDRAGEGAIEADPLCECQDFTHFTFRIQSLEANADGARAEVAITNFGESNLITLHLVQRGGAWLIADVGEGANRLTQTLRR
jgi:hypothetical protein